MLEGKETKPNDQAGMVALFKGATMQHVPFREPHWLVQVPPLLITSFYERRRGP